MSGSCFKPSIASNLSQNRSKLQVKVRPWALVISLALSLLPQALYFVLRHALQRVRSTVLSSASSHCTKCSSVCSSFLSTPITWIIPTSIRLDVAASGKEPLRLLLQIGWVPLLTRALIILCSNSVHPADCNKQIYLTLHYISTIQTVLNM